MEIAISPSAIVPEVLQENNYERWSILMQHYLVAQDLWDVVQSNKMPRGENKREWIKKNASALHAIGISCGTKAFDQIKNINSAKLAWDVLAVMLKPTVDEVVTHGKMFEHHQGRQIEHQETLRKTLETYIHNKPISSVKRFIHDTEDAKSPQMLHYALQLAITHGRKNMARYLYREIPREFLKEDRGFFLLEECTNKKMFDIAFDLLYHFRDELAFKYLIPIILTLAESPPPFLTLNELGFWGRWIYKSTRAKAFPIKPGSASAGGVDKLRKWILPVLYKFHLVGVIIGLLCWLPCWLPVKMHEISLLIEVFLMFVVPLLKLDLVFVLIGVPFLSLVPLEELYLFASVFAMFILLLVILRKCDLVRVPIGMPLLIVGAPIWIRFSRYDLLPKAYLQKEFLLGEIILFLLFLLFSMPLMIFVMRIYKQKLMDEYALEVIRFTCGSLSDLDENQFVQSGAVEVTFKAIKNGIPEILIELITKAKNNADILWSSTDLEDSRNMFACAVAHRQEKVAQFLHENGASNDANMVTTIDEDGNNILHLAAKLAPHSQLDHIPGAALQLQNELHWFKSVEGIVPQFFQSQKNKDGETPTQLFVREHAQLHKEAEAWMKKVAESCTVVGALVITILFAAAFTVPGGNNEQTGLPIFLKNETGSPPTASITPPPPTAPITVVPFMVFAISDAIALFAASSSVLMFMGILTSRYAFQDFHISLPIKLIIGLSSLFISIAAMMIAFCATLYLMLNDQLRIVIPIIFLASIPVTVFVSLQSPLLVEIYNSTFRPDIFYKRKYVKGRMRFCLSLNRRWWFRTRKGRMVVMLCALALLFVFSNVISYYWYEYFFLF